VDAVFQTIKRITDRQDAKLTEFTIRATSGGEDAVGEVTVRLAFCDGKEVLGRGASTDIIEASARAFISAINRQILIEGANSLV
jgi:2-isopropylmalate synthase